MPAVVINLATKSKADAHVHKTTPIIETNARKCPKARRHTNLSDLCNVQEMNLSLWEKAVIQYSDKNTTVMHYYYKCITRNSVMHRYTRCCGNVWYIRS